MKLNYKDSSMLSADEIKKTAESLLPYLEHLQTVVVENNYDQNEGSINLPSDEKLLDQVKQVAGQFDAKKLKYIVDIGIGGSNLGAKAVYDALYGFFDVIEPNRAPKMIFADTNNPDFLARLKNLINSLSSPDEIVINAISKSGGTTETTANMEIIVTMLEEKFGNATKRLVITTDKGSKLWNAATEKNIAVLEIPKLVGGRYSIFSTVGMFPLMLAGVNVERLRKGAIDGRTASLNKNVLENPALVSAVILFLHSKKGNNINDNFFFHGELESVGKWYRQLMGESIGKEGKGITPTVSIGSTDLHSVVQLYLGGPKDKTTTFVVSKTGKNDVTVPQNALLPGLVNTIYGKNASHLMSAILEGTKIAYAKQGLPFTEIVLNDISEQSLGQFLQVKMIEMMFLGKLLGINTFDQPHVELYKIETKKILEE